ncbi:MAG: DNRLRE domain-containing protein [Chloroflexi bacterium]|nr:DNRLRE domain-containing protein [Chloroflexota bacterium]
MKGQRRLIGVVILEMLLASAAGLVLAQTPSPSPPQEWAEPAASLTLTAQHDSWVNEEAPTTNYGAHTSLEVGRVGGRVAYNRQALIQFNLSELPADAVVSQARLQLYQHDGAKAAQ